MPLSRVFPSVHPSTTRPKNTSYIGIPLLKLCAIVTLLCLKLQIRCILASFACCIEVTRQNNICRMGSSSITLMFYAFPRYARKGESSQHGGNSSRCIVERKFLQMGGRVAVNSDIGTLRL